jgi:hypothetical protein
MEWLQLELTPFQDAYAAHLHAALEAEPRSLATCSGHYANGAHVAARQRERRLRRGTVLPVHTCYSDVSRRSRWCATSLAARRMWWTAASRVGGLSVSAATAEEPAEE